MKKLLNQTRVPRWIVLVIDFIIIVFSFTFSYFILKQFQFASILRGHFFIYTALYSFIALIAFYIMKIHTGVIRYSTLHDMFRIFSAILFASLVYVAASDIVIAGIYKIDSLSASKIVVIDFFISSSALILFRTSVRGLYYYARRVNQKGSEKVIIYGADPRAIVIKQALEADNKNAFKVVGFIENKRKKTDSYIQQKKVFGISHLGFLKEKYNVEKLVITNDDLFAPDKQEVINICLGLGIKILTVPPADQWIYGKLKLKQIQDLTIEDLLQRDPIEISTINIFRELSGKRILITGAAGSIGSEIVRQVLRYKPEMVILCDQSESALHDIQLEVEERYPDSNIKTFIASVRNLNRMLIPFKEFSPQIIFHAAAYKHVPMMENHPSEAVLTNVMGTKNIADLAILFRAEKFVMISTDKAVNPTNVMGASKRIAEMYIQSLNNPPEDMLAENILKSINHFRADLPSEDMYPETKFMTTRFGNVLDSNGSVIPRFRKQIQNGGPVTVTHPEIMRYFMTIPEAVQLVLEAGSMGKGGEIFLFDMGRPIKIAELASNMIKLAGLTIDKDIKIEFTGLRPGEKLYEELLNDKETTIPTHHEKIKIAKVVKCSQKKVMKGIEELLNISSQEENLLLVQKMKQLVPEFISQNSQYQILDVPAAPQHAALS